ncbi:MAG: EamA family transporter [Oscillospiraceae bacterium]|nr:EamA family transporter [Oscillospiraceae bacterium]
MVFSLSTVCSKMAAQQEFLSLFFIVFYGLVIFFLGIYAICWQQVIKNMPLTTAYANKAVTVIWGLVWGSVIFKEQITLGKILGSIIIIIGIILFATADKNCTEVTTDDK